MQWWLDYSEKHYIENFFTIIWIWIYHLKTIRPLPVTVTSPQNISRRILATKTMVRDNYAEDMVQQKRFWSIKPYVSLNLTQPRTSDRQNFNLAPSSAQKLFFWKLTRLLHRHFKMPYVDSEKNLTFALPKKGSARWANNPKQLFITRDSVAKNIHISGPFSGHLS